MEETVTWRIFGMYMLVMFFMLLASGAFAQMKVIQFNAGWNSANEVPWVMGLEDCNTYAYIDIAKDTEAQTKHKIAVIPTIIDFRLILVLKWWRQERRYKGR